MLRTKIITDTGITLIEDLGDITYSTNIGNQITFHGVRYTVIMINDEVVEDESRSQFHKGWITFRTITLSRDVVPSQLKVGDNVILNDINKKKIEVEVTKIGKMANVLSEGLLKGTATRVEFANSNILLIIKKDFIKR